MTFDPIGAIVDFVTGAATRVFEAVETFLLKLSIVGINLLEIVLFVVFVLLIVGLLTFPAKVYEYYVKFARPVKRFFSWVSLPERKIYQRYIKK